MFKKNKSSECVVKEKNPKKQLKVIKNSENVDDPFQRKMMMEIGRMTRVVEFSRIISI